HWLPRGAGGDSHAPHRGAHGAPGRAQARLPLAPRLDEDGGSAPPHAALPQPQESRALPRADREARPAPLALPAIVSFASSAARKAYRAKECTTTLELERLAGAMPFRMPATWPRAHARRATPVAGPYRVAWTHRACKPLRANSSPRPFRLSWADPMARP